MRTIVIFIALMFCNAIINAQVPRTFKYQTLAHDQTGSIYSNKDLTFKISILKGIVSGKLVYSEIHKATTNASGLVELNIGNGNFILTDFTSIDWLDDTYFIKVEMDTTGNGTFINMSTSQLLSVPYALASKISEQVADNSVTTSKIANNAVNISKLPPGASSTTYLRGDGKWAIPPISLISLGGENGNIQYNNSGSLGGSSELFFDSVNQRLGIGNKSPSAKLHISTSGSESFPQLRLHENSNEYSRLMFQNNSDPGYWMISAKNSSDKSKEILKFSNIPKSRIMIFSGDGKVAINPPNEIFSNARLSILEDNSNNYAILATNDGPAPTIHAYNEGSGFAGHFITNSGTYALFCGNKGLGNSAYFDGPVYVTGKNGGGIKREQTSSANIVPICYGTISANGSKGSGCTPNFTVTRQSKGVYDIKIKDENFISSTHTCIASLGSLGFIYSSGDSGNIRVNTYSISGKSADKEFSIVVFKP